MPCRHGHWKTSSFIGALRCDGLSATGVIDGAINGAIFLAWVEQIEAAGASLLFIPPYSPDLNPIEQAFAKLKALLRARALRTVDALWKALGSLVDCFTPEECVNFLRHDGYFQSA